MLLSQTDPQALAPLARTLLRVATAEGRLTFGELTERTEAAYTATTRGELVPITADLSEVSSPPAAPMRPAARADRDRRAIE